MESESDTGQFSSAAVEDQPLPIDKVYEVATNLRAVTTIKTAASPPSVAGDQFRFIGFLANSGSLAVFMFNVA